MRAVSDPTRVAAAAQPERWPGNRMKQPRRYLYRAFRPEEIDQRLLIPKSQEPFRAFPRLDIDTRLPFTLGAEPEYAVRQHQWQQHGYDTRGVSTTPHLDRARFYAAKHRVIVVIYRDALPDFNIEEFVVHEWLAEHPEDIACVNDDEVILVASAQGPLPADIIERLINVEEDDARAG